MPLNYISRPQRNSNRHACNKLNANGTDDCEMATTGFPHCVLTDDDPVGCCDGETNTSDLEETHTWQSNQSIKFYFVTTTRIHYTWAIKTKTYCYVVVTWHIMCIRKRRRKMASKPKWCVCMQVYFGLGQKSVLRIPSLSSISCLSRWLILAVL